MYSKRCSDFFGSRSSALPLLSPLRGLGSRETVGLPIRRGDVSAGNRSATNPAERFSVGAPVKGFGKGWSQVLLQLRRVEDDLAMEAVRSEGCEISASEILQGESGRLHRHGVLSKLTGGV